MKTNNRLLLLLLPAASLLLAGGLGAQQPDRRPGPPSPSQMLERFDANGNGSLEKEELETAFRRGREQFEERRENRFGPTDGERSGRPNRGSDQARGSERARGSGKGECPRCECSQRGRGAEAGERSGRGRPDSQESSADRRSVFLIERFDEDGDGLLSPNEVENLLTTLRQMQDSPRGQGSRN